MIQLILEDKDVLILCAGMKLFQDKLKNGFIPATLIETTGLTTEQIKARMPEIKKAIVKGGEQLW